MAPEKPKPKRPLKSILSLIVLCALGLWLDMSSHQDKNKLPVDKPAEPSTADMAKPTLATTPTATDIAPEKIPTPAPIPPEPTTTPTSMLGPMIVATDKPIVLMREPSVLPLVELEKPAMRLPDVITPPFAMASSRSKLPEEDDLPKIPPSMEGPPKDVTSAKALTRDMEGKDDGEFGKPDPDDADKITKMTEKGGKATSSKSSDMAGWELMRYHDHDFVTGESLQKFYRFNELKVEGNNVWFRSPVLVMKATLGSVELLINNIKFIMSYPAMELNGKPCFSRLDLCKLIDPVLRPSYIGNKNNGFDTVILDPGHGGHDSGAKGVYGYEKDYALKLANSLKAVLLKQGLKVQMTRTDDTFVSLASRVAFANKIPNSIYVSLHFNSGGSSATGIETFAFSPQGSSSIYGARSVDSLAFNGNSRDSENIALATSIHASVVHRFKLVDRGVKRARWHVLKGLERPGVLFEGGFVTSPVDCRLIAAENFRSELAVTIGQAIMNYRRALQPRSR